MVKNQQPNNQSVFIGVGDDGEIELNLRYISPRDVRLVSKFMASSHNAEITLPAINSLNIRCRAYTALADLLLLLKNHSVLDIIDNQRSSFIEIVKELRVFRFGGSWVDSLETLVIDKAEYDYCHIKKLMNLEKKLKLGCKILRNRMKLFAGEPKKVSRFRQQMRLVKSKLANLMGKKKVISDARKSLKFFYPI